MRSHLHLFAAWTVVVLMVSLGGLVACGAPLMVAVSTEPIADFGPSTEGQRVTSGDELLHRVSPTPWATKTRSPTPTFTPEPTSTPVPIPTPIPRPALPVELRIPAVGVDARIEHVGLTEDLAMDVPSTWENVAWYKLGYRPGEAGNAVIAGHLDTATGAPAVFWDLELLEPGDEVFVVGEDGTEYRFVVESHARYAYDEAPVQDIFGPAPVPRLALITCDGNWDRLNRNYSHRVVLYATADPKQVN